jgi:NAD(P)-dependent dehydrogenase (short-subunit alcohol dehydrogenase family)
VFLTGRNAAALDTVAKEITASGGTAHTAVVDALDKDAVESHASAVAAQAGSLDISFNPIAVPQEGIQDTPLAELTLERFTLPVIRYMTSHFLTTRAAARRIAPQQSGVILTLAEVASAAVFAVSDQAAAITGTVLNLSGGSLTD